MGLTFKFFIGGYGGTNHKLDYDGTSLTYHKYYHIIIPSEEPSSVKLTSKQIEDITDFIYSIKWDKEYIDNSFCDGTQWELIVKKNIYNKTYYGSNSYPKNFNDFLAIINGILGSDIG